MILCSYMSNFQSSLCVYFETSFFLLSPRETQALVVLSLSDVAHCCVVQAIQSRRVQIVRSLSLLHFLYTLSIHEKSEREREVPALVVQCAPFTTTWLFSLCVFSLVTMAGKILTRKQQKVFHSFLSLSADEQRSASAILIAYSSRFYMQNMLLFVSAHSLNCSSSSIAHTS